MRLWLWPNLLSLDAPLVALVWQYLFARCFHVPIHPVSSTLLGLAVWLIYTADRVLDAWAGEQRSPRHRFYRRNWRALAPWWLAALATATWLALTRLPTAVLIRGSVLLTAVALYFLAVHLDVFPIRWPKEAAVAVLFALGASLDAWDKLASAADFGSIALFSCLCWINCSAIEQWEYRGRSKRSSVIRSAALGIAMAALVLVPEHRPILGGAEMLSALALVLLDRSRNRLSLDALRVLADVALLTPILFLPLAD